MLNRPWNIPRIKLAIGVKMHNKIRALRKRPLGAGLQCRALPAIHRVPQHRSADKSRNIGGGVIGPIINHQHFYLP